MRIALAQIDVFFENKEKTKNKCLKFIEEAKKNEVDLIVFPEMTLTGFSMNVVKIGEKSFDTVEWFKKMSLEFDICSGFGFVEAYHDGKGKNNFSITSFSGNEILRYTKIHPFSYAGEDKYYSSGNTIKYCNIKEFTLSTFICYDLRFPEIFLEASRKAECIVVIANWPHERIGQWETLLKARAVETQSYIAAVNRVGTGEKIYYSGCSMIVSPYGETIISESINEKLLIADLDLNVVKECRDKFRYKKDRREKLYCEFFMKR
ncbi:carbon-nitrogen family hydrolase [Clostridium felsineum]|uniref:nitrilase-related carbon-nitrogen hydrolase n=1 Tax=Clostridium felsineum TaxID=36839 RepID=UPI00214D7EF7|nr:nitrilase-related carbon-nitrogen hydrolase [Clostridium felsineum]MCR3757874.1 carbon-nitrogen family hydrolase [Clostridium felsineum]